MRIHTDDLTAADFHLAARTAGVSFTRFTDHGSRIRERAFDVILTGSSPRRQNAQRGDADYAATWCEWGVFLSVLFFLDYRMLAGTAKYPTYASAVHFSWATGGRYDLGSGFTLTGHHKLHRWEFTGEAVTGSYAVHECQCGAIRRIAHTRDLDSILA